MPRGQGAPAGLSSIEVDSGGWSVSPPGVAARVRTRTAAAGDGVSDVVEWLAHHRDDVQTCQACPEVLQITDPQSLSDRVKMLSALPLVIRLEFEDGKGIAGILSSTAS